MILLTRMDKQKVFINPDHIVSVEETPDTVITLFNDHHFIVMESASIIISKIVDFRSKIIRRAMDGNSKRYLNRSRKRLFRSPTSTMPGIDVPDHRGRSKKQTPSYFQDI